MYIADKIELRTKEEEYINLDPLQRGGVLPAVSRKAALSYVDGYSICDLCLGALHLIKKPPVYDFLEDVAKFLGMGKALLTNGCREAKFIAIKQLTKPGQAVVLDANRHYSSYVAAEANGVKIYEVPNSGYPEFKINPEDYRTAIERVKKETGELPALVLLTHADWIYGNIVNAEAVGKICREYSIPFLLNTAYSSGRMPIDGKKLGADIITCSGHKSWAAGAGNVGILAVSEDLEKKVIKFSEKYKVKPLDIIGCSARGASTITLMASFPHVKERVKRWGEEVEKNRFFNKQLENLGGINQLGDRPHNHDLVRFETPVLDEIAQRHKKKGYFLAAELEARKIVGVKPGKTKAFDVSTYGLSKEQLKYVVGSFSDIIKKFQK